MALEPHERGLLAMAESEGQLTLTTDAQPERDLADRLYAIGLLRCFDHSAGGARTFVITGVGLRELRETRPA